MTIIENKIWLWILIPLSIISIISGIAIPYCFRTVENSFFDSNFVGACFSLAGVLMFCAALIYQIKEYKIQVEELKKSVEAQTSSSKSLDEQKQIMLEQKELMITQNSNDFLFSIIENFNKFKAREDIQKGIKAFNDAVRLDINDKIMRGLIRNDEYGNIKKDIFLPELIISIQKAQKSENLMFYLKSYINFSFYILDMIIHHNSKNINYTWFRDFFLNQFTNDEAIILYLTNLTQLNEKYSIAISWDFYRINTFLIMLGLRNRFNDDSLNEILKAFQEHEYKTI